MRTKNGISRETMLMAFEGFVIDHKEYAALAKLSFRELDTLAHDREMAAKRARYALWRRLEEKHAGN